MRWRVSLRAAGLVVVLSAAVQLHAGVMYTVTDLGTLGGRDSEAHGINDLGQVVGWSRTADDAKHAFRTAPNQPINPGTDDLDVLGPSGSAATAINNLGQVVGWSFRPGERWEHAFRTGPNQAINPATDDLGTLGGTYSAATAINDAGLVVGHSTLGSAVIFRAFRTAPNQRINPTTDDLGTLGGQESGASGINAAGQVVGGASMPGDHSSHAFRTAPNKPINPPTDDLGTLGGPSSDAGGISASGQVAGTSAFAPEPGTVDDVHIFRTRPNQPINVVTDDLGTLAGAAPSVHAINDLGHIVGVLNTPDDRQRAFVYLGSTLFDLNDVIEPSSDWVLQQSFDINERGQIVGVGYLGGQLRAFRLDPIPEPSMLLVSFSGIAVFGCSARSHRRSRRALLRG